MNVVLIAPALDASEDWFRAIMAASPNANLVRDGILPDEMISVAIVDGPPPERLGKLVNLRLIISLSAGIDAIGSDPDLAHVPIVRLVTAEMVALMREYVCYHAIRIHRGFALVEQLQRDRRWEWLPGALPAMDRRITVLGLGALGRPCAEALRDIGFRVSGWSRSAKIIPRIQCVAGMDGLRHILPATDILINVLPLTPLTRNLLSSKLFDILPRGASVVNVGRGNSLSEADLIRALDSGQLSHATLDVFSNEPLPPEHPLWSHPKVTLTPHTAAYPKAESFIAPIAAQLTALEAMVPLKLASSTKRSAHQGRK